MNVLIVNAGAGSGKTTDLTGRLAAAVAPTLSAPVRPEKILAATFTRRAAQDLRGQARRALLSRGLADEAQRLEGAWIGTVHAVCERILREFSFDLGISPDFQVTAAISPAAIAEVLDEEPYATDAHDAARAFSFDHPWTDDVEDLIDLARDNGLDAAALAASAARSLEGVRALLDPPDPRGAACMDDALRDALRGALDALRPHRGEFAVTDRVLTRLEEAHAHPLSWPEHFALARLEPARAHESCVAALQQEAARCLAHPRLHHDLERYLRAVFHFATRGLEHSRAYREAHRLADFVDLEERTLELLENPDACARLADRLDLLLVDEFQDTSPIQLAIFTRLARLARRAIWVGDPKQSIYAFRGAAPGLLRAGLRALEADRHVLEYSWRSRPPLVRLASSLFSRALAVQGMSERDVILHPRRDDAAEFGSDPPPPLSLWRLQTRSQPADLAALAEGIRRILQGDVPVRVLDRAQNAARPARAGDIAVLCRRNDDCEGLAAALSRAGVPAALSQTGLLSTMEAVVAQAALRLLLDSRDTLAAAQVAFYDRPPDQSRDQWLDGRIGEVLAGHPADRACDRHPAVARLRALAHPADPEMPAAVTAASPAEALSLAIQAVDLPRLCVEYGSARQRLDNLEALRGLAHAYEESCAARRAAATTAGLVAHLRHLARARQDPQAFAAGADAVQVVTYHSSKGLEWPVVILSGLDRAEQSDPFEPEAVSNAAASDPFGPQPASDAAASDPLAGRWIRFWPWPFGKLGRSGAGTSREAGDKTRVRSALPPYRERAEDSEPGRAVRQAAREEEVRLLYVAMTRARDHLVLAARQGKSGPAVAWLDRTVDARGLPVFDSLPWSAETPLATWEVAEDLAVPAWVLPLSPPTTSVEPAPQPEPVFAIPPRPQPFPAAEAAARDAWGSAALRPNEMVRFARLPDRLKRTRQPDALGKAVHAFLAADPLEPTPPERRLRLAERILEAFAQTEHLHPSDLITAADQFRAFVDERYPGAIWHRETPLSFRVGRQEVHGIADLLLELPDAWVVVDHKTYNGPPATWEARAPEHFPQLEAYARAVETATGLPVAVCWLHFPLAGGALQLLRTGPAPP